MPKKARLMLVRTLSSLGPLALKILFGDRTKYIGLIVGIAFSTFLMAQQISIFIGILSRTASQIEDVAEADIWVMDKQVEYFDEIKELPDIALASVRSVAGVEWAVPLAKALAVSRAPDGETRQVGVDDNSLVGVCRRLTHGKLGDINLPDAMIIDRAGHELIWPGQAVQLPRTLEINDRRVLVVGVCEARPPFVTFPVVFARYSEVLNWLPPQRNKMSFVLVKARADIKPEELAKNINSQTGLQALTWPDFKWRSINYYLKHTGIPVNFGITVMLGFLIGAIVAGQTFFIFVIENLRQFGALKAIGYTNRQLVLLVLMQAAVVGAIGFALGIGGVSLFFTATADVTALRLIGMDAPVMMGVGLTVLVILIVATFASIQKLLRLDPAIVFRG
jgi:putative ABC transport system permease protein